MANVQDIVAALGGGFQSFSPSYAPSPSPNIAQLMQSLGGLAGGMGGMPAAPGSFTGSPGMLEALKRLQGQGLNQAASPTAAILARLQGLQGQGQGQGGLQYPTYLKPPITMTPGQAGMPQGAPRPWSAPQSSFPAPMRPSQPWGSASPWGADRIAPTLQDFGMGEMGERTTPPRGAMGTRAVSTPQSRTAAPGPRYSPPPRRSAGPSYKTQKNRARLGMTSI